MTPDEITMLRTGQAQLQAGQAAILAKLEAMEVARSEARADAHDDELAKRRALDDLKHEVEKIATEFRRFKSQAITWRQLVAIGGGLLVAASLASLLIDHIK